MSCHVLPGLKLVLWSLATHGAASVEAPLIVVSLDGMPVILIGCGDGGLVRNAAFSCISFSKARVASSSIGVMAASQ